MKKRPGRDVDHSPPRSVAVKNEWSYTPVPPLCLRGVDGDNLILSYFMFIKSHKKATCVNRKNIWANRVRSPEVQYNTDISDCRWLQWNLRFSNRALWYADVIRIKKMYNFYINVNLIIVSSISFEHPKCSTSGRFERAVLWFSFHAFMESVWSLQAGCAEHSIEHILPATSTRSVGSYCIGKCN